MGILGFYGARVINIRYVVLSFIDPPLHVIAQDVHEATLPYEYETSITRTGISFRYNC